MHTVVGPEMFTMPGYSVSHPCSKKGRVCGRRHILADSAYPNLIWVLSPFRDNGHLTAAQKRFNQVHASIRSTIERTFGLLKGRFPRLQHIAQRNIQMSRQSLPQSWQHVCCTTFVFWTMMSLRMYCLTMMVVLFPSVDRTLLNLTQMQKKGAQTRLATARTL